MRRKRKYGMLVGVKPLFDSEENDKEVRGGAARSAIAWHHAVPCWIGGPCVRLISFRYRRRRYKVTQRNVLAVLCHEEIHHVLIQINEDDASNRFDWIAKTDLATKEFLGLARLGV
jgi:hypothetical protein